MYSGTLLVPSEYSTIQSAIDNANIQDTILVEAGEYEENISIDQELYLLSSSGPNNTTLNGSFSGSVVSVDAPGDSVYISGFTIRNGTGNLLDSGSTFGGGIISHNTKLFLDSIIVEDNEAFAGGGICFYEMQASEIHSRLLNSIVRNNLGSEGGGVFAINQFLTITSTSITGNGMIPYGSGGGIQVLVGDLNLDDVVVSQNHSRFGGGIYIGSSQSSIHSSIISNNESDSKGGGVWVGSGSNLDIMGTLISDNYSDGFGAGIFISLSAIAVNQSTIAFNTVSSNVSGAGIFADGGNAVINNSIIYFNRREGNESTDHNLDGYSSNYFAEYTVEYSDIEGSTNWVPDGMGVISLDPEFEEGSYLLSSSSPCIDAGDPDYLDADGTRLDMGAYYYEQDSCGDVADLNHDQVINILDVIAFVNIILEDLPYNPCYDINQDGEINILDIIHLVQIILGV